MSVCGKQPCNATCILSSHLDIRFLSVSAISGFPIFNLQWQPIGIHLMKGPSAWARDTHVGEYGGSAMVQGPILHPVTAACHVVLDSSLDCFSYNPALCLWLGNTQEDNPSPGPCTHVGDHKETPGTHSPLIVAIIWGVNQKMENFLSLFLLLSL